MNNDLLEISEDEFSTINIQYSNLKVGYYCLINYVLR